MSTVSCQLKIWELLTGLIVYQTRIEALCDYLTSFTLIETDQLKDTTQSLSRLLVTIPGLSTLILYILAANHYAP